MSGQGWALWAGLIVATWSVTRLLIKDEFPPTRLLRQWVVNTFWDELIGTEGGAHRPGGVTRWVWFWRYVGHSIAYVFTCPWCMSVWGGRGALGIASGLGFSVPLPWLMIAAARVFCGLMGAWDSRHDQAWAESEKRLGR